MKMRFVITSTFNSMCGNTKRTLVRKWEMIYRKAMAVPTDLYR
jgi:hypothetical protein